MLPNTGCLGYYRLSLRKATAGLGTMIFLDGAILSQTVSLCNRFALNFRLLVHPRERLFRRDSGRTVAYDRYDKGLRGPNQMPLLGSFGQINSQTLIANRELSIHSSGVPSCACPLHRRAVSVRSRLPDASLFCRKLHHNSISEAVADARPTCCVLAFAIFRWIKFAFVNSLLDINRVVANLSVADSLQERKFTVADGVTRTACEIHSRRCHQISSLSCPTHPEQQCSGY